VKLFVHKSLLVEVENSRDPKKLPVPPESPSFRFESPSLDNLRTSDEDDPLACLAPEWLMGLGPSPSTRPQPSSEFKQENNLESFWGLTYWEL